MEIKQIITMTLKRLPIHLHLAKTRCFIQSMPPPVLERNVLKYASRLRLQLNV